MVKQNCISHLWSSVVSSDSIKITNPFLYRLNHTPKNGVLFSCSQLFSFVQVDMSSICSFLIEEICMGCLGGILFLPFLRDSGLLVVINCKLHMPVATNSDGFWVILEQVGLFCLTILPHLSCTVDRLRTHRYRYCYSSCCRYPCRGQDCLW